MDPELSPEQALLQSSARSFLQRESPASLAREMARDPSAFPDRLWGGMAALGWLGLGLPEAHGGGGSLLDLVLVCEELGRVVTPAPFLETVVLAGRAIAGAGNLEQHARLLPRLIAGELRMTLATFEPGGRHETDVFDLRAAPQGDGWALTGTKTLVPHAVGAEAIICVARTAPASTGMDGLSLFVVDARSPGLTIVPLETLGRDRRARLELDQVRIPAGSLLGRADLAGPVLGEVLRDASVALAAEMVGGAERVLEMTVDHARNRIQLGGPLAALQALQHRCADVAVLVDVARALVRDAAWRISHRRAATTEASMAKSAANECYRRATWVAAEIHGGTGFMDDHDLPLHYRRARAAELTLGDSDLHLERIAAELLD
jgi:alkylation response protein AidB-like acyl-CoA dehydrogenase